MKNTVLSPNPRTAVFAPTQEGGSAEFPAAGPPRSLQDDVSASFRWPNFNPGRYVQMCACMSVCMYVRTCICTRACMYVYVYMYIYTYVHTHTYEGNCERVPSFQNRCPGISGNGSASPTFFGAQPDLMHHRCWVSALGLR